MKIANVHVLILAHSTVKFVNVLVLILTHSTVKVANTYSYIILIYKLIHILLLKCNQFV